MRTRAIVGSVLAVTILFGGGIVLRNALAQGRRLAALLITAKLASVPEANGEARLQLAAEAARRRRDPESGNALLKALLNVALPRETAWGSELARGVVSMAISPDDQRLYAVAGNKLRVIDLSSGQERLSAPMSEYPGAGGKNNPVLLFSGEKLLMLWNRSISVVDGRTLRVLSSPISGAIAFTASADGTRAAFLLLPGEVILCDLASNCESFSRYDVKDLSPEDLELSADGKSLAIIQGQNTNARNTDARQIALFDTMPWKQRKARSFHDVSRLAISVDEQHVHLCTPDALRQYDAYDNSLDETMVRRFAPKAVSCRFFGERTVTSHADGAVRVWDETGTLVTQVSSRVDRSFKMALGESTLVAASDRVRAWDITPYGRQNVAAKLIGFVRGNSCAYGEDKLMTLESGEVTTGPNLRFEKLMPLAIGDSLGLAAYMASSRRELIVATLRTGEGPVRRWTWPINPEWRVTQVTISLDERHVAVTKEVSSQKSIAILDAHDGSVVKDLPGKSGALFAPGGDVLTFSTSVNEATKVAVDKVMIVSLKDGAERGVPDVQLRSTDAASAAFSPDGHRLALTVRRGENSVVDLFEWPGLKRVGQGLRHPANVTGVSFRSDGQALLTSTTEGTTYVWDLATQKEILRIPLLGRQSATAVFLPSGRVAILDDSGALTVLPANPDDLLTDACRRVANNLTPEDWALFVGSDIAYRKTCPNRP
jgi:WD40 repeat protein